tara:strand:+ start:14812 stop:17049 length:2238 start_codon:yes stop_codon:yes gene_type:complete
MARYVSIAVPVPLLPPLTYRIPANLEMPEVGARVRVPLGSREVVGCVLGFPTKPDSTEVKDVTGCLDRDALIPPQILKLALWVAEYYACGPGDAVGTVLPPLMWGRTAVQRRKSTFKTIRVANLTKEGQAALIDSSRGLSIRGVRQREALEQLKNLPDGLPMKVLAKQGIMGGTVQRLVDRGLVCLATKKVDRDPFMDDCVIRSTVPPVSDLSDEQRRALTSLKSLSDKQKFQVALLHGVTGSGKTAVYVHLAAHLRKKGRQVLVLVPEIALTPAVVRAFRDSGTDRVAVQHSGLSDGERHDQWHRIRRGDIDIVVGTRSCVFAPVENVGLIIVDEEHDSSYKQEDTPRYHGRDVAVMRGQQAEALVVLGSATPSMESYHNVQTGRYECVVLKQRVLDRPLAAVSVVDMRTELAIRGPEARISTALEDAIAERLERNEQSLVLLNRRGFSAAVLCRHCGQSMQCPNCSVSLTFHRAASRVRCHYCNYSARKPAACPDCAGEFLDTIGFGTERIEGDILARFSGARVARLDRDTVGRRGAMHAILDRFAEQEIDILVGTQMVAKGHDFPAVTLVGVISADVGLGLADFRVAERTFQLLTQVAGRAGRGERAGEAIIQTFYPDHYSIGFACRQEYNPFFNAELMFRESMQYPPIVAMVNVVVRGHSVDQALQDASALARALRREKRGYQVLGPAPAPMTRIRGEHRVQLFLKGTHRRVMREAVQAVLEDFPTLKRRITVDIDPLSVL